MRTSYENYNYKLNNTVNNYDYNNFNTLNSDYLNTRLKTQNDTMYKSNPEYANKYEEDNKDIYNNNKLYDRTQLSYSTNSKLLFKSSHRHK